MPDTTYDHFVWARDQVVQALCRLGREGATEPSEYWSEELAGFDYMLEASPLLVKKLRQQSYHLTGIKHFEYRSSQEERRRAFASKLEELRKADGHGLFVPESPALGGFGHVVDGQLVNVDTLKFYESLIALDRAGVLADLRRIERPVALEIGAGWGGFAFQFLTHFPSATYVIVDFPEVFLFSASYLRHLFPGRKILVVKNEQDERALAENIREYDIVFLPQERFAEAWAQPCDLAINMVSFQEMTTVQVDRYAGHLRRTGAQRLYSHNRDRSRHNNQLSRVSEILEAHFELKRISFMSGDYTDLNAVAGEAPKATVGPAVRMRRLVKAALFGARPLPGAAPDWIRYRHLVGRPLPLDARRG